MCYKFNPIYWQTANLIVDSGAVDEEAGDGTDYGKMAVAIAMAQHENVNVDVPLINSAKFGFTPDVSNNRIIFGFKGINGIGDDIARTIIQNQPFKDMEDFEERMIVTKKITNKAMIQLIKGNSFSELCSLNKKDLMNWFLKKYLFKPYEKLTLQQLNSIVDLGIVPSELQLCLRMLGFKSYVFDIKNLVEVYIDPNKKLGKKGYHDRYYTLDDKSQEFFTEHLTENSVVRVQNGYFVVSENILTKEINQNIQSLKKWFNDPVTLGLYNHALYTKMWNKYAKDTEDAWSMQALNYYDKKHELDGINESKYGIENFFDMPEEPEVYDFYTRYIGNNKVKMPKYRISRIAGTVIHRDKDHSLVYLLTVHGCVTVKFTKGHFAYYNKRISILNPNNSDKKIIVENSWFERGSKLIITGVRFEHNFKPMRYNDTIYQHVCNKIEKIYDDGTLFIKSEREKTD